MSDLPFGMIRLRTQTRDGVKPTTALRLIGTADWGDAFDGREKLLACLDAAEREFLFASNLYGGSLAPGTGPYSTSDDIAVLSFSTGGRPIKVVLIGPLDIFQTDTVTVDATLTSVSELITFVTSWGCDVDGNTVTGYLGGQRI